MASQEDLGLTPRSDQWPICAEFISNYDICKFRSTGDSKLHQSESGSECWRYNSVESAAGNIMDESKGIHRLHSNQTRFFFIFFRKALFR